MAPAWDFPFAGAYFSSEGRRAGAPYLHIFPPPGSLPLLSSYILALTFLLDLHLLLTGIFTRGNAHRHGFHRGIGLLFRHSLGCRPHFGSRKYSPLYLDTDFQYHPKRGFHRIPVGLRYSLPMWLEAKPFGGWYRTPRKRKPLLPLKLPAPIRRCSIFSY